MNDQSDTGTMHTLAGYCSLCGGGYHPNLEISIADEPMKGEYRWAHEQCKRDHDRAFVEAFVDRTEHETDG